MALNIAPAQAPMYFTGSTLAPPDPQQHPFQVLVRATGADFFTLFDVPLRYGSAWSEVEDERRSEVVVLGRYLNERLFAGANSVGRTVHLGKRDFRVIGVLDSWAPVPRFYEASNATQGRVEDLFIPFGTALDQHLPPWDNLGCPPSSGFESSQWDTLLTSECIWVRLWVELPTAADVQQYRKALDAYVAEQRRSGRFDWPPRTALLDVGALLAAEQPVPNGVRLYVLISFGFLLVCLVNAVGLMLARFMSRAPEVGVRRALGATRTDVLFQCLAETAVIGLGGGLLGMGLCTLGLAGIRSIAVGATVSFLYLDRSDLTIAILTALGSTVLAGLYPMWRAVQVQPAWQLKVH
jgi:putative ABC transport system permease protein